MLSFVKFHVFSSGKQGDAPNAINLVNNRPLISKPPHTKRLYNLNGGGLLVNSLH